MFEGRCPGGWFVMEQRVLDEWEGSSFFLLLIMSFARLPGSFPCRFFTFILLIFFACIIRDCWS